MNVGEKIKQRRKELGLSVDQVAKLLGKNRATVYRYENQSIENLPITVLSPLAKILETTPGDLMTDTPYSANTSHITNNISQLIDLIPKNDEDLFVLLSNWYNEDFAKIFQNAVMLNENGILKLLERSEELLEIPKYQDPERFNN